MRLVEGDFEKLIDEIDREVTHYEKQVDIHPTTAMTNLRAVSLRIASFPYSNENARVAMLGERMPKRLNALMARINWALQRAREEYF